MFYIDYQSLQTDFYDTDGGVHWVPYWWRKWENPAESTMYRLADATIPSHIQAEKTALSKDRTVNLRSARPSCYH